jgi:predicted peptidase
MNFSENSFGHLPLPYLVFTPKADGPQLNNLLVYLHGSGDRGKSAQEVRDGWGLLRLLGNEVVLPFSVVAPICPENEIWKPVMVANFLTQLKSKIDRSMEKIILCGYSMGATGAYAFQSTYPGEIHALVAVAGGVTDFSSQNMALIPIFAVYGSKDKRLTDSKIAQRIEEINQKGGQALLKIIENKDHYISDEAFALKEMNDWLLKI